MTTIPGAVVFFTPTDIVGDMIAFYTKGRFSHCGIALTPQTYVDAQYPLVMVSEIKGQAAIWTPGPGDFTNIPDGVTFLHSMIGEPYSLWDIVNSAIAPVAPLYVHDLTGVDCSVGTMLALQRYGYGPAKDYRPEVDAMSPNDIARMLGVK